jgi:CDP-glucose 4,6-dehydratase
MESMVKDSLFNGVYKNKRVVITGHTGFKGSWLTFWLKQMGANVSGIALDPPTKPNHYHLLNLGVDCNIQDINSFQETDRIIQRINPDIIFHLAAQPLVRLSYEQPITTIATNVIGTANILESARRLPNLKAVIVVTSDKCYDNKEWVWGYRENEPMGGLDPYSASKGCVELITNAYRKSFFEKSNSPLIASARAGNVIGGGDWAQDRIMTDIVTAANNSSSVFLRYPNATRPWQYVLEPLSGYLTIGWRLLNGERDYAEAWNFGPNQENNVSVLNLVKQSKTHWNKISYDFDRNNHPHEAGFLMLDSSKAMKLLGWKPVWGFEKTVEQTIGWYKSFYEEGSIATKEVLENYIVDAQKNRVEWSVT